MLVYVHEPAGNVDSWRAVGNEPVIVHITVHGPIDYLDANDQVVRRVTSTSQLEVYRRWCDANGVPVLDLRE